MHKFIGYVDLPQLSTPSLEDMRRQHLFLTEAYDLDYLSALSDGQAKDYVFIVQDPFTSFYDAELPLKTVKFLQAIGKKPVILPFNPNGKPQHVKGFLKAFKKTAKKGDAFLQKVASTGIQMIGLDASMVLCYRDEYRKILGEAESAYHVQTLAEYLNNQHIKLKVNKAKRFTLLAHCTEKTAIPATEAIWQKIFTELGLNLDIASVGCCGMAGTYGHEAEHLENSIGIYNLSWKQKIDSADSEEVLATGYSCRSQVKRINKYRPRHPIEALSDLIEEI